MLIVVVILVLLSALVATDPDSPGGGHQPDGYRSAMPSMMDFPLHGALLASLTEGDGHDSGLFTWEYLYFLGSEQDQLWADYERRLKEAGMDRDAAMPEKAGAGCGRWRRSRGPCRAGAPRGCGRPRSRAPAATPR